MRRTMITVQLSELTDCPRRPAATAAAPNSPMSNARSTESDGNTQLADSIGDILSDMIDDGTWRQAVRGMRRQIGYTVDSKLNPPDPAASSDTASSDSEQGDE